METNGIVSDMSKVLPVGVDMVIFQYGTMSGMFDMVPSLFGCTRHLHI